MKIRTVIFCIVCMINKSFFCFILNFFQINKREFNKETKMNIYFTKQVTLDLSNIFFSSDYMMCHSTCLIL
jgi:hypothetical protein